MKKILYPLLPHQKILLLRAGQQLSIRDLSNLSGVHPVKIHRIEFGVSQLRINAAAKIVSALTTTPEELASSYWEYTPAFEGTLAEKFFYLRQQQQVKLKVLSRAVNASPATLCRIESGQAVNPVFMLLKHMSDYYQVAISWLMGYNNN